MIFPKDVEIIEVGPRDGLQNEPNPITTDEKKELINRLAESGFKRIETASFVHPKWVPQMADSEEIAAYCNELGLTYIALTPNMIALERALAMDVPQVAVFIGASNEFNKRNVNRTTDESLKEAERLIKGAKQEGKFVRAYISMAFKCPFQGYVSFEEVDRVCSRFVDLGVDEVDIGDTNGQADPKFVYERFARLTDQYPDQTFVAHFHDTNKMALANVIASMQAGITKFDSSAGGLGGCPYSPGATGNIASERIVHMVEEMGCATGINPLKLREAAQFAKGLSSTQLKEEII
ncbi:hydroxymethylglutaryl-CoA lyase [Bacillus sp. FJAT-27916]|uniref:hydroxymethylglutaryl-CoA lyase n=1 Tax=Bacillaceae TaxID=186817 RepID=UPI000670B772|nr:hydroxymethylglutaryl-CoA lyase [Bacillus sp. FJAT-27916]KMY44493.1 hydroxymethylglutaryl-CoA lyase [Bacillus sp. FJAT-27916]